MPVYTGVMVLYSDDLSFTVMTAEGLPEAGWNTFSAYEEDGATVVQIQSLARASDPIYEVRFLLFGSTAQEKIWTHVPHFPRGALRGARTRTPGERLRGPEAAVVSGRKPLAQCGPQVRPVHRGRPDPRARRVVSPRQQGLGHRIGA